MKIAHVHIPKTAGGSVNDWFKKNSPDTLIFTGHKTLDKCDEDYDFSFCIFRNTYHRLISAYEFSRTESVRKYNKRIKKGDYVGAQEAKDIMEKEDEGIISWLSYHIDRDANTFWTLDRWSKDVDLILHQENLSVDFQQIQKKINCFVPLEKSHHVLNYDRKKYLTEEYIDFVTKNYKEEIEKYGYQP